MRGIHSSAALVVLVSCAAAAPSPYFLTPRELDASRGHVDQSRASTGLADFSEGNVAEVLIDGEAFLARLYDDLSATKKGDVIHWGLFMAELDIRLVPPRNTTQLGAVLFAAVARGVKLRAIMNHNLYLPTQAYTVCHKLNAHCSAIDPDAVDCCIPEDRHAHPTGSVHEKTWLIGPADSPVAYLGSMDITSGRWDTPAHDNSATRRAEPKEMQPFYGWHGNMIRFAPGSPVVNDLARRFWLHWNMEKQPAWPYKAKPYAYVAPTATPRADGLSIQLLQTLGCRGAVEMGYYLDAAPRGERSIMDAAIKAVRMATRYIVIEDQFMFFKDFMVAVADVLPRLEAVYLITDPAASFDLSIGGLNLTAAGNMRAYHQRETIEVLMTGANAPHAHKVRALSLHKTHADHPERMDELVYIHSKNYFVDDEYLVFGSAGLERASLTNDYEVAVGIADAGFVAGLRRRLWAEYLAVPLDDPLLDDMTDLDAIDARIATGGSRLANYQPRYVESLNVLERELYELYEPEGRCK